MRHPGAGRERIARDLRDRGGKVANVPESASIVPVLVSVPLTSSVDTPRSGCFLDRPLVDDGGGAAKGTIGIVDSRVGLNIVRRSRSDLERRRKPAVAVQPQVAQSGLKDGAKVVEHAVVIEDEIICAIQDHRPVVGQVAERSRDETAAPQERATRELENQPARSHVHRAASHRDGPPSRAGEDTRAGESALRDQVERGSRRAMSFAVEDSAARGK